MRARNIKPGFFTNEQLAEVSFAARLLYIGLWCMADREGRLEDRPKRIKMEVFPGDSIEINPLLGELAAQDLIVRYEVDGGKYIEIPTFLEHQRPHHQEKDSVIPPRSEAVRTKARSPSYEGTSQSALNPDSLNPECSSPKNARERASDRFDEFWALYPRRVGKAAAKRAWSRKGLNAKADEILEHLRARVRSDAQWLAEGGKFIPHPQTWLNRDGWLDEYQVGSTNGAGEQSRKPSAVERAQRATGGGF